MKLERIRKDKGVKKIMCKFNLLCTEYRELKRMAEEIADQIESVKSQIIDIMGDKESLTIGADCASYKEYSSVRIDTKRLKAENESIYNEYAKTTSAKRFTIK